MTTKNRLLQVLKTTLWIQMASIGMTACAQMGRTGEDTWHEQVLLNDGQKIVVERSQTYGGRHEIGQEPPVKEQTIRFTLPNANGPISWTSEYDADLGRTNFNLLALHVKQGIPYLVAVPNLCLSYNKWGRPNPPYVVFKLEENIWKRIPLNQLPVEFKKVNLVINNQGEVETLTAQPIVASELVDKLNGELSQPEYKNILREPLPKQEIEVMCEERVLYKGAWILPNDPVARKFIDSQKK